jgi:hypothetical protein
VTGIYAGGSAGAVDLLWDGCWGFLTPWGWQAFNAGQLLKLWTCFGIAFGFLTPWGWQIFNAGQLLKLWTCFGMAVGVF